MWFPVLQSKKQKHDCDWHVKMVENAFIVIVLGVALLKLWVPKSYEIIEN